ncbi:MAG: META domain-containing protein [Pseudomonadales bacterium]|nr:META domain-containing protein [Pseudomonadales bacterium]
MIKKTISLSVSVFLVACQAYNNPSLPKPDSTYKYTSTILQDGTSVLIKLPNGEQRTVLSDSPTYSATIGMVNVQGQANKLVINASQPTVTAAGQVTGSGLFKPNAPEGAHWQLIAINGQAIDARHSKRPPYIRMSANKMQGLTGCNVMSGFYNRLSTNNTMQFIQVQGGTEKCDYQSLEASFIKALQALREWRITPDYHLQFLSDKQQVVAEFVALSP